MSEKLGMERTTLTRGISNLERDGLVKRYDSEGRRSKSYILTERGKEYADKGAALLEEAQNMLSPGNDEYKHLMEI